MVFLHRITFVVIAAIPAPPLTMMATGMGNGKTKACNISQGTLVLIISFSQKIPLPALMHGDISRCCVNIVPSTILQIMLKAKKTKRH